MGHRRRRAGALPRPDRRDDEPRSAASRGGSRGAAAPRGRSWPTARSITASPGARAAGPAADDAVAQRRRPRHDARHPSGVLARGGLHDGRDSPRRRLLCRAGGTDRSRRRGAARHGRRDARRAAAQLRAAHPHASVPGLPDGALVLHQASLLRRSALRRSHEALSRVAEGTAPAGVRPHTRSDSDGRHGGSAVPDPGRRRA